MQPQRRNDYRLVKHKATPRLIVCPDCRDESVMPTDWEEWSKDKWWVELRCGNCEKSWDGVFSEPEIESFDVDLDTSVEEIKRQADKLLIDIEFENRKEMTPWVRKFIFALEHNHILSEDF